MALVVEDGTGLSTANSYLSIADFKSYWVDRGTTWADTKTDAEITVSLIKATQYIDNNFTFQGARSLSAQALEWPQYNAVDCSGYYVTGLPVKVGYATAEAANIDIGGTSLFASVEQGINEKTENVPGAVQTTYKYNGSSTGKTTYASIINYLKCFTTGGNSKKVLRY